MIAECRTVATLLFLQRKWIYLLYLAYCAIAVFNKGSDAAFLVYILLGVAGGLQGHHLRVLLSFSSSFIFPAHNKIQITLFVVCGVLLSLPPLFNEANIVDGNIIDSFTKFMLFYSVAGVLGYYRDGILLNVFLGATVVSNIMFDETPEALNGVSLLLTAPFNVLAFIVIIGWLYRVLNKSEPGETKTANILRLGLFHLVMDRQGRSTTTLFFGRDYANLGDILNRFALRVSLRNSILRRQFGLCGASAITQPAFSFCVTVLSILLAAVLSWSNQQQELVVIFLLLPLIIIAAPFMNELAVNRKNISLLWLRDSISCRKNLMASLAIIQVLRLFIPMVLWALVISSGLLLVESSEKWVGIYFLIACYFPTYVALSFLCGILNKNNHPLINQGFIVVHIIAMVFSFFVATLGQSVLVPMVLLSTLLAGVSVVLWTRQDIETGII